MRLFVALSAFLLCLSVSDTALSKNANADILLNDDVKRIISEWKDTTHPSVDPFSGPSSSTYAGKQVLFEFDVTGEDVKSSFVTWSYDRESGILKMKAMVSDLSMASTFKVGGKLVPSLSTLLGFYIGSDRRVVTRDSRTNTYGAVADVEVVEENLIGLAQYAPTGGGGIGVYEHAMEASPEDARELVQNIRFMALGVVQDNSDGHPVMCGSHYSAPTVRHPTEVSGSVCVLNVGWAAFAFIDKRSGQQLRTWG